MTLMVKNPQFYKHLKHIAICWHWVYNLVQEGKIHVDSCRDPEQTVDMLTKALPCPKHKKYTSDMGLVSV